MLIHKELRFEFVTPAFIGGVTPASDPEVRTGAIAGMLRYWLRALTGGVIGTSRDSLKQINSVEHEVFGGVFGKPSAREARLEVVDGVRGKLIDIHTDTYKDFATYLGYGLKENGRKALEPGHTFRLRVICADRTWPALETTLRTWAVLGGIGSKHRRGFGCLKALDLPQKALTDDRRAFAEWLSNEHKVTAAEDTMPEFEVVHPRFLHVKQVPTLYPSWEAALRAIRKQLRVDPGREPKSAQECLDLRSYGFRQRLKFDGSKPCQEAIKEHPRGGRGFPYYPTVDKGAAWDLFQGRSAAPATLRNIQFGLPLPFPGWDKMTVDAVVDGKAVRRPSPVSFRISKEAKGCRVTVVFAECRFLPEGGCVEAKFGRGRPKRVVAPATLDHARAFFDSIQGKVLTL